MGAITGNNPLEGQRQDENIQIKCDTCHYDLILLLPQLGIGHNIDIQIIMHLQ